MLTTRTAPLDVPNVLVGDVIEYKGILFNISCLREDMTCREYKAGNPLRFTAIFYRKFLACSKCDVRRLFGK